MSSPAITQVFSPWRLTLAEGGAGLEFPVDFVFAGLFRACVGNTMGLVAFKVASA